MLTVIIYQVNSMSQFNLASEIYWKCVVGGKRLFWRESKKNPRQDIFQKNVVPKESFFFVASDVVPILYSKPCILEINIVGRDGIIQIWIISSKDINTSACARFIVENWDNIWCSLMHLKKNVMGLQIAAFKNCTKWTSVYKDYWR